MQLQLCYKSLQPQTEIGFGKREHGIGRALSEAVQL
jgi:hypothetical protein